MPSALGLALALLLAFVGMGWLALAMETHWTQVMGDAARRPATVRALRLLGALALVGALAACLAVDRPSMAALVWVMALIGGALAVAQWLAWRPGSLHLLWPGGRG